MRFPWPTQFAVDQANHRIRAGKLGWIRARFSKPIVGSSKNMTISREGARWYCSLQIESSDVQPAAGVYPSLGLDLGVVLFAAGSDGSQVRQPAALGKKEQRLKRYQRSVSRKCKGSKNRRKAVLRLANLHRKISRQRADWLHKKSTELANSHAVIVVENLKIKNMTASARGTVTAPGKNVRAKASLNRAIQSAGWGEFQRQLAYKLAWRCGQLLRVDPSYTSQRCSSCGHLEADNRRSQASFRCVACGHAENADINAAKNILAAGHAVWAQQGAEPAACGEDVRRKAAAKQPSAASMKQEPTEGLAGIS